MKEKREKSWDRQKKNYYSSEWEKHWNEITQLVQCAMKKGEKYKFYSQKKKKKE